MNIPFLVSITAGSRKRLFLAFARELVIGCRKEADLIVNHPALADRSVTLALFNLSGGRGKTGVWEADGLIIRSRSLRRPLLLSVSLLLVLAILPLLPVGNTERPSTQDWTAVPLPAAAPLGFCRQDHSHTRGILYSFESPSDLPQQITFTPGGKGDGSTLSVSVNGRPLPGPVDLPAGWGAERSLTIPAGLVQAGLNTVKYVFVPGPSADLGWGLKNVRFTPLFQNPLDEKRVEQKLHNMEMVLGDGALDGPALARSYQALEEMRFPGERPELAWKREALLNAVKDGMLTELKNTVLRIRSARTLGEEGTARGLTEQAREWVPGNWPEGRRILDGA